MLAHVPSLARNCRGSPDFLAYPVPKACHVRVLTFTPPILAEMLGCVCLYTALCGSGMPCGCVCLGSSFGCALQFLARVLGCVCLCARSANTPLILAGVCGVCVWAQLLAFLPPIRAGLLRFLCSCARSAFARPVLPGVSGVAVCLC